MRRRRISTLAGALAVPALLATSSSASAAASLHASFSPNRLGAATALTLSMRLGGEEERNLPRPVRRILLSLPAGLRLDPAGVGTCSLSTLASRGPRGCPRRSTLGGGHAVVGVHAGSQTIPEQAVVWAFRAPDRGGRPAMWIVSKGETPLQQTTISTASLGGARAPYGVELTVSIPPIRTLEFEPDASVIAMSLTVGRAASGALATGVLSLPGRCPAGGFPFAASFAFTGGPGESAADLARCP